MTTTRRRTYMPLAGEGACRDSRGWRHTLLLASYPIVVGIGEGGFDPVCLRGSLPHKAPQMWQEVMRRVLDCYAAIGHVAGSPLLILDRYWIAWHGPACVFPMLSTARRARVEDDSGDAARN